MACIGIFSVHVRVQELPARASIAAVRVSTVTGMLMIMERGFRFGRRLGASTSHPATLVISSTNFRDAMPVCIHFRGNLWMPPES